MTILPYNDSKTTRLEQIREKSGLTPGQVEIWTGQSLHPDSPLYNMAFAFFIEGEVRADCFRVAWQTIVDGSDALRTFVADEDGFPVRRIHPGGTCPLGEFDFSSDPEPDLHFLRWSRDRCSRSLPLDGCLVDSVLVRLGSRRFGWYLNQHHLVTDASATVLLFRRVAEEYARVSSGESSKPPESSSYYRTVSGLADRFDPESRAEAIRHWQDRLSRGDRRFPFYGETPGGGSTRSERLLLELDAETSLRLRESAGQEGFLSFTPDISMFAVFATLLSGWLHHLTGRTELGFDAPAQNRPTPAAKDSLGLFIELFPFAVDLEPGDTFRTLGAKCLAETQLFLRSALPGTSSRTGSTVSNIVLNFFSGGFGDFFGMPVSAEWIHSGHSDAIHACRLQVHDYERSGRFHLHFDLNHDAFPERLRKRAVAQFEKVLRAFLDNPDAPVAGLDILVEDERNRILTDFNAAAPHPLPDRSVIELFDQQARLTPDRTALEEGSRKVTFAELAAATRSVAAHLLASGLAPGDSAAVFMRRSIEAVVAILSILRARGAYVPVDPGYPEARIRHILDDCEARLVLVSGSLRPPMREGGPAILIVDGEAMGAGEPADSPQPPLSGDLAYTIYTSGSTGLPKGVGIEHGGLADYLTWADRQYVRGERLSFALFTSLSFDLTVTSLYLPLITGGTLVIYPESPGPVDTALMDVMGDNRVDLIKLTPSHLSLLRQLDVSASRIRRMVVGGEDFKTRLAGAIHEQFGGRVEIFNEYGPTEAVVGCMIHRYDPSADTGARVPIGRPADHVGLYVLNGALVPVPEGVPGELCIARYGLARGYHGRPDLTAERFIPHPLVPGGRLYRTGDLVRFHAPGSLEYLGRIDRQLKISGFRVEPAEIESALLAHRAIHACVVTAEQRRKTPLAKSGEGVEFCRVCGLPSNYPNVVFDVEGVCSVCRSYEKVKEHARAYFRTMDDLKEVFAESARRRPAKYDCMMLFSGGKDSTYALCQLVDLGLKVYVFSLDNGYISEQAKANIRRVVDTLGVDHEFGSTPAMNDIFRDSLVRFSNVCNGCFKTIYTLSMARARELGIPLIVTGLSRGQFFETRLTENLFRGGRCNPEEVDAAVLAARKAYHRTEDEVSRSLDVSMFRDDRVFDEIRFVDFYRYCDVGLSEILGYLAKRVPWIRPSDTGRSTNCRINDVGIYIHQKERGYHNYALPYSWDVRMGHKTRDEALAELHDELDLESVRAMLADVSYDEDRLSEAGNRPAIAAYYVAAEEVSAAELRRHLAGTLPGPLVPQFFRRIEAVPLTANGKVDLSALPSIHESEVAGDESYVAPEGPVEERLAAIWQEVLGVGQAGACDTFFALGGTSLAGMEVMLQICNEFEVDLPLQTIFQHPSIRELATAIEKRIVEEINELTEEEAQGLIEGPSADR